MKALQYKDKQTGLWKTLPIILAYPTDGEAGQVLTKTDDGVEWSNVSSSSHIDISVEDDTLIINTL